MDTTRSAVVIERSGKTWRDCHIVYGLAAAEQEMIDAADMTKVGSDVETASIYRAIQVRGGWTADISLGPIQSIPGPAQWNRLEAERKAIEARRQAAAAGRRI